MFSTNFIFRQQENLVDNQKCQAGFRPLCNKILFLLNLDFCGSLNFLNSKPVHFTIKTKVKPLSKSKQKSSRAGQQNIFFIFQSDFNIEISPKNATKHPVA